MSRFTAFLLLGCMAVGAAAQDESDGGQRVIEEVVVTAEKRESTVSDTSISITALDENAIEELGIQSPDELVNFIPATTRDPYGLRGMRSTNLFAYGVVAVPEGTPGAHRFTDPYTGAVAWGAPPRPGVDPAPQMPVHAFGGTPHVNGAGDLDEIEQEVLTNGYNNEEFDHESVSFDVTWDASESVTVRYLLGYSDFEYTFDFDNDISDGVISQGSNTVLEDVYTYSHELQLLWDVGDQLEVTAGVYNFYSNRLQDYTITNIAAQGRVTNGANYGFLDLPLPVFGGASIMQVAGIGPAVGLDEVPIGTTLSGRWVGGDGSGDIYRHKNKSETDQYAAFAQGTYRIDEQWALTAGVRWAEDDKTVFENRGGYVEINFLGAFAALYPFLLPSPVLVVGQTDLSMTNILMGAALPTGNPANPIVPTCAFTAVECETPLRLAGIPLSWAGRAQDSDTWGDVSWRLNLDWTPDDNTLVYLSATTGYRAGGYGLGIADARAGEPGSITPLSYDQEHVLAFEVGYKGTLLDETLQLNMAVYTYDYENYQDQIDSYDPIQDVVRDVPTNTGDARNSGFEADITWLPTDALTINANYSFADTEYQDSYTIAEDDNPERPVPLFGNRVTDLIGNNLKRIPEQKATLWASYEWPAMNGRFVASGSVSYTGAYYTTQLERDLDEVPDRTRVDMRLTWFNEDESLRVSAFVDNLFDAQNLRGIGTGDHNNFYRLTGSLLYPRYWGIDVRRTFGS